MPADRAQERAAFGYVTSLFFAWGFATSLIDPLIAAVKRVFDLNFTEAFLTTFAWFIAYGLASLPAAAVLARLGYVRAIIGALVVMVAGCLIVPLATALDSYAGVLVALFVIACGVTLLQVAANPLVAELGPRPTSHRRLNLSQAFNSLGTVLGPWLGAHLLLTGGVFAAGAIVTPQTRLESLRSIDLAFVGMGAFFAVIAVLIGLARRTIAAAAPPPAGAAASPLLALRSPWACAGAAAIFLYVGSEVAIGSILTNFLASSEGLGAPIATAGKLVALYWAGAMLGRFVGSALMRRIPAAGLLAICTAIAALICFIVTQATGPFAAYAAIAIGLFNSIMFPTIFTLTLERSSAPASATSGLLVFGIIGGALIPPLAGRFADAAGAIGPAFVVPMAGYIGLAAFALFALRGPQPASAGLGSPH